MRVFHRALRATVAAALAASVACLDAVDPEPTLDDAQGRPSADGVSPSDSTDTPLDTMPAPDGTIRLLEPAPWAWIPQNDSTLGCPAHQYRGYGFRLGFQWAAPDSLPTPAAYHLYAKNQNALYPIIDVWLPDTEYQLVSCNAFVIDRNLSGWFWTVEAIDSTATVVAQSEVRWFGFLACRLENGQACSAPGAPAMAAGADRPRTGIETPLGR